MTRISKNTLAKACARQALAVLVAMTVAVLPVRAENHVLTLDQLRGDLGQTVASRHARQAAIDNFLTQSRVQKTLRTAGMDPDRLRAAAALMSDQEQAQLATRVQSAQSALVGGEMTDAQSTLIILAVAGFCFLTVLVLAFK